MKMIRQVADLTNVAFWHKCKNNDIWRPIDKYGEELKLSRVATNETMLCWLLNGSVELIEPQPFEKKEVWPRIFKIGNGYNIAFGLDERMYCVEHDYSVSHSDMLSLYDWLSKENFPKNSEVTDKEEMQRVLKVFEALGGKVAAK